MAIDGKREINDKGEDPLHRECGEAVSPQPGEIETPELVEVIKQLADLS